MKVSDVNACSLVPKSASLVSCIRSSRKAKDLLLHSVASLFSSERTSLRGKNSAPYVLARGGGGGLRGAFAGRMKTRWLLSSSGVHPELTLSRSGSLFPCSLIDEGSIW